MFLSINYLQTLATLKVLPIPNKNVLKDSKVLDIVEKWYQELSPTTRPADQDRPHLSAESANSGLKTIYYFLEYNRLHLYTNSLPGGKIFMIYSTCAWNLKNFFSTKFCNFRVKVWNRTWDNYFKNHKSNNNFINFICMP